VALEQRHPIGPLAAGAPVPLADTDPVESRRLLGGEDDRAWVEDAVALAAAGEAVVVVAVVVAAGAKHDYSNTGNAAGHASSRFCRLRCF
jgi:hypothetical protein